MIFQQRRLKRELSDAHRQVLARQALLYRHVVGFGQQLRSKLGTSGLIASGFAAGWAFDHLRPRWQGLYSIGGVGVMLMRIWPLAERLTRLASGAVRRLG
jgi:hypothetical protein